MLEGPTGRLPRGRRPTFLRLNDERVIIGVDIRPTQTTVALADANGKFTSQEVMATPADPQARAEAPDRLAFKRIKSSCRGKKIEGVGISLPGPLRPRVRPPGVRAQSEVARRRYPQSDRRRPRVWKSNWRTPPTPACWRRSGSTAWRSAGTWWWSPCPKGIGTGRSGERAAGARTQRHGGRIRPRAARSERPASAVAAAAAAGRSSPPTARRCATTTESGATTGRLTFTDLLSRADQGDMRAAQGARDDGALPGARHAHDRRRTGARAHRRGRRPDPLLAALRPRDRSRSAGAGAAGRRVPPN